jgi:hypothetical protein
MLSDADHGSVQGPAKGGRQAMTARLLARGLRFVTFEDWKEIDRAEVERGQPRGAPRSKFVEIPQMIDLVEMKRRGW